MHHFCIKHYNYENGTYVLDLNAFLKSQPRLFILCAKLEFFTFNCVFYSDIDECVQGLAGCDHNCTNTNGSYYCTCMDGYTLESDNHVCIGNDYVYEKTLAMYHNIID